MCNNQKTYFKIPTLSITCTNEIIKEKSSKNVLKETEQEKEKLKVS